MLKNLTQILTNMFYCTTVTLLSVNINVMLLLVFIAELA